MASKNFMQVGPGGICFAHGPYEGQHCPMYENNTGVPDCACITDPRKPEYVALAQEQMRQTNKVYTQADLDAAIAAARAEQREEIAFEDDPFGKTFFLAAVKDAKCSGMKEAAKICSDFAVEFGPQLEGSVAQDCASRILAAAAIREQEGK